MRVISFNANGIRSAARKGFFEWLQTIDADFVCIQETKAHFEQLKDDDTFFPGSYTCQYVDAEKKGYSGVAIYAKQKPILTQASFGFSPSDDEGRYLQFDYDDLIVISMYLPSGTSGTHRQTFKYQYLDALTTHLKSLKQSNKSFILCGDYNIAHQPIDLKNWRSNQKNSGFLPEERAWLDYVFDELGFVDAFRAVHPETATYTWWSNRGRARENDVGWRIDYQLVSPNLKSQVAAAQVFKTPFFSDHAPLVIDYNWPPKKQRISNA